MTDLRASVNPVAFCEGGLLGGNLKPTDKIKTILPPMTISYGITALNELQRLYNGKSIREDGQFGMKLPKGYEANIVPRSSTYKNFKILQTNCFAVIDNSYSGNEDQWMMPVVAMEDTVIHKNDRICQFRINKIQPTIKLEEVENLDDTSRGGIGSSGTK